jgi:ABC-2 type transport system permease protein
LGFDVPARFLYSLNPMVGFTEVYRDLLYNLRFPSWGQVAYITGAAIVALVFGQIVFGRLEGRLAEEL